MNKAELIDALAVHFGDNKAEASRALKAVLDTISEQLVKGEKVSITGFGVFEKMHRAARMVRNPRTGERKKAKATDVPRFRPGSELKALVSGEKKIAKTAPAKPAAAKKSTPAKAATKSAAVKAPAKSTAKAPAKAATKPAAKTTAKAPAKAPAKTTATKTTAAKKTTATKTAVKTTAAKKTTTASKKTTPAKAAATKTAAKTTTAKKTAAKKTAK